MGNLGRRLNETVKDRAFVDALRGALHLGPLYARDSNFDDAARFRPRAMFDNRFGEGGRRVERRAVQ